MRFFPSVLGRAVAFLIAFGGLSGLVQGQPAATPGLEQRVRELEQTIQALRAAPAPTSEPAPGATPGTAGGSAAGTGPAGTSSLEGGGPPRGTAELGRVPTGPPGIELTRPGE